MEIFIKTRNLKNGQIKHWGKREWLTTPIHQI